MAIERSMLQDMFDGIRSKTDWDIDGPMLWGYFFTDTDRNKLLGAASVLEEQGYNVVGLLESTPEDDDQETIMLHVEKIEVHSVDSLHARNTELYSLAAELGLATYDGMDVGPVEVAPDSQTPPSGSDSREAGSQGESVDKPWWKFL